MNASPSPAPGTPPPNPTGFKPGQLVAILVFLLVLAGVVLLVPTKLPLVARIGIATLNVLAAATIGLLLFQNRGKS